MKNFDLSDEECLLFLKNEHFGDHLNSICSLTGDVTLLSSLQRQVVEKWNFNMNLVQVMFNDLSNDIIRKTSDPFEKKITLNNGHTYWRGDYIGYHLISIEDPADNAYITITVKRKTKNFYLKGSNCSATEICDFLQEMKEYFPLFK